MAKYDWNTFRNYVAFLAGRIAPGTRRPHHDSELTSCYHDAFLTWGHYHNNIVLFYHDSPITRSHFMDPTDRAIKGFYCTLKKITCPNLLFSCMKCLLVNATHEEIIDLYTQLLRVFHRADPRFAPSQWKTALLCNDVFHWLSANLESALFDCPIH